MKYGRHHEYQTKSYQVSGRCVGSGFAPWAGFIAFNTSIVWKTVKEQVSLFLYWLLFWTQTKLI